MAQLNKPIEIKAETNKNFDMFMQNLNLFTPEQIERVLKLLELTMIPRYEALGKAPIEEEYLINRERKSVLLP